MRITPVAQLTFSMVSITLSMLLIAFAIGLVPSNDQLTLQERSRMAENLAIQTAVLASHGSVDAIKDTFAAMVTDATEIVSVGLRKADGSLIAASPGHQATWEKASTSGDGSHVVIPLMNDGVAEANIEIQFQPLPAVFSFLGFTGALLSLAGFIGGAGAVGYYLVLRRSLRELDPGSAFPDRVSSAFDALAAGVLILDENHVILLANKAFETNLHAQTEPLLGQDVNALPWVMSAESRGGDLPWDIAVRSGRPVLGTFMSLRKASGVLSRLVVNATPITNGRGVVGGVMVTFDDVSIIQQKNEQLNHANLELRQIKDKMSAQNEQLRILASTDALTGCLNRRTFLVEASDLLKSAHATGQQLSALMLDIDHFKQINDQFGHPAGDAVLAAVGEILRHNFQDYGIVGRYGGEEFGIVFIGLSSTQIYDMAEQVRKAIAAVDTWLPDRKVVTVSMGFAMRTSENMIGDIIKLADQALYKAKNDGRNRVVESKEPLAMCA